MGAESSSLSEVGDDCLWSTDYFNLHSAHLIDGLTVSAFIYKPSTQSTYLINNAVKVSNITIIHTRCLQQMYIYKYK